MGGNEYFSNLLEVLSGSYNIQLCIFILISLTILFIFYKSLADLNINFDWLLKYKYGS